MICCRFREPNFQCEVVDARGDSDTWLRYAESEGELRHRLLDDGYTVVAIRAYNFNDWRTVAAEATGKVKDAFNKGETLQFDAAVWSQLKPHLFDIFHGKCAYCESEVLHISYGDVEHYRPKKRVDEDGTHPGYYWLAYEPTNLVPCCEKCNRARGKQNHFPVAGQRARAPSDSLDAERPLMLNPAKDDPSRHFSFPALRSRKGMLLPLGSVVGRTTEGKQTVLVCNLDRPPLREKRRRAQQEAEAELVKAIVSGNVPQITQIWKDTILGVREYSAAVLAWLNGLAVRGVVCPPGVQQAATGVSSPATTQPMRQVGRPPPT